MEPAPGEPLSGVADPGRSRKSPWVAPAVTGGLLVGLVIFALGVVVTLLLWKLLQHGQDLEIERGTQTAATTVSGAVESWANGELEALRRRAGAWSPSSAPDANAWYREAATFLSEHPAYAAIARLQGGEPTEIAGSAVVLLRAREAAGGSDAGPARGERVIGPIALEGGRQAFAVLLPLADVLAASAPTLFAVLDPTATLIHLLDRQATGYAIRISAGDALLYRRGAEPAAEESADFARSEPIRLGLGEPWTLRIAPSEETFARNHSEAPRVVLLSGLVISALISSLVYIGQLSRERARALRLNVDLRDEIAKTRLGESEIRVLNESLERRVRERTAELNETIAELETFNYSVSHDLRSPLGAVINFAAILKEDYDALMDDAGREYLGRLVSSARVAVSMMDALLAFSRSGRGEVRKTHVDMRGLVEEVIRGLAAAAPGQPVPVRLESIPEAHADPAMMRFVFMNLIGNAFKFVRPGESPQVEVGGHATETEVTYFVRDQGIGFDMRYADKLFKLFERLHAGEDHEGHGVGLAIVARMVRRHGGRVWAQGAMNKGATFHFSLPTERTEPDASRLA